MDRQFIRNFSIIAHIDHGKSTLADRFIQLCGALTEREMKSQVLDSMDLERERGITIKAQSVTLYYTADSGQVYQLNLIDTPGHVDFSYEVSRSLSACEGALLVVDAAQGVEAQTVATCYTAIEQGIEVLPVLNKIDLPHAEPDRVKQSIEEIIGLSTENCVSISAKSGLGIRDVLEQIITSIPAPCGETASPLKALVIDSWFDSYLGIVSLVRIVEGSLSVGDKVCVMSTKKEYLVDSVGIFTPKRKKLSILQAGEVGFVIAGIKDIFAVPVGDTLTLAKEPATEPVAGFEKVKPQVFSGLFPVNSEDFELLRTALSKLQLNDAALFYEPESSQALGFGFRCGFLGMLHREIVQERLERDYALNLITTAPTVVYEVECKNGETRYVDNPSLLPSPTEILEIREPIGAINILLPKEYLGRVIQLCVDKRGIQKGLQYLGNQVSLTYWIPMSEVILDFFDKLQSATKGFASLDYSFVHFEAADLVKLDILINSEKVDALEMIVHRQQSLGRGRSIAERLKTVIPRQLFDVAIQATIGGKIISRTTVKALRKNVTAKCYGGDITRKKKLLKKQKEGKKRMKQIGSVEVPQEAFLSILQTEDSA